MTTHDALLAAVLANPADDLPRLVYADWLEENGQSERAEFVRVQVEWSKSLARRDKLGRKMAHLNAAKHKAWDRRERELLTRFGNQWVRDAGVSCAGVHFDWKRGFVAEIRCTLADWCGGECPDCDVTNTACPTCSRPGLDGEPTGTVPGIGPAVVAAHPVERVVLVDREPRAYLNRWVWDTGDTEPSDLPLFLYDDIGGIEYPSREDALDALSLALIAWAKSQSVHARISATPVSVDIVAG